MSRFTEDLFHPSGTTGLVHGDPERLRHSSWREVHDDARRIAGGLARAGVGPGTAVAVLAGGPGDIARIAQACWMRGASVTMLHPPLPRTDLAEWATATGTVLEMIEAQLLILGEPFPEDLAAGVTGVRIATYATLLAAAAIEPLDPVEDEVALLQLTAGSTGTPKAVAITHRNLYAGTAALREIFDARPDRDSVVMWLPLYHDMGMICLVTSMRLGLPALFVTPMDFLRKPLLLPELISAYRGTITCGPNFSYAILARRLRTAADGAYDLSSLRAVISGAEPIDPEVVREFTIQAARFGMSAAAMAPAYGMAEATLLVSASSGAGMLIDQVDQEAVEHRAFAASAGAGRHMVRLGYPPAAMELRVVDAERRDLPARGVGEILIRGASVTAYYLTPEGRIPARDNEGWLATGDLGYRTEDGELVICGRAKDIIIIAGRNILPTDIEWICETVPGVRAGNVVAIRTGTATGQEGFAVLAESAWVTAESVDAAAVERLRDDIATAVQRRLGIAPRHIGIVRPGTLPKTSSGKLRRDAARRLLDANPILTAAR
ncbi:long-chain-fatty-acid--CoA ligase [Nocardia sp. NBC_01503]|uniref:long-chain-fatty-acid--CoA ligase n=1 Tax=Nocardia sp. NBC_01503 TaxID=2975997 RepID=UPI002E7C234F|nr:long-chain-fatty-acid--CoA ligase [Nocardia sp. NBC_01503]WTL34888.1 long-chain-fatty-acid--CoA ligase [Nocardia sp. NBC_01503]